MPSPISQIFRKNDGGSPAERCGNEDLECGHGSPVQQTPTASGYQSSPSRVYLPDQQSIHTPMVPQTPTQSCEYFSHVQYNGEHGSAAQMPRTPSGPSRVVGYLPRNLYSGSSPFVGPTRLVTYSQFSQNAGNSDFMSNRGLQRRSTSISSTASHRSLSPRSPFDPGKHGQALRRLETHGSLKTVPSGQQEVAASNRASITWSQIGREIFEGDQATGLQGSLPQQLGSRASAGPYETANQRSGAEVSTPPIQYLPNTVYQPPAPAQGDSSRFVNLPDPPETRGGQNIRNALPSFVFPLTNAEADNTAQITEQALHPSQVWPEPHQTLFLTSLPGEIIAAHVSPNLWSKNASSEGMPENDTNEDILRRFGSPGNEYFEDMSAYEAEGEEDQQTSMGHQSQKCPHPAHTFVWSPTFQELDEFVWSPPPSDDGQEALSSPCTLSDALRTSPVSGLVSDPYSGPSRPSKFYGNEHSNFQSDLSDNICVIDSPLPHIDVLIPGGKIDLESHPDFLSSSHHASRTGSRESSRLLFRYSGVITDGASSRPMSEIELKEEVLNALGDQAKCGWSMLSSKNSTSQMDCQISGEPEPNARPKAFLLSQVQNPSADAGPGSSQTSSSLNTDRFSSDLSGYDARLGIYDLASLRTRCPTPPLLFGRLASNEPKNSRTKSVPAPEGTKDPSNTGTKATRSEKIGRLPTTLCSLGEQDWETISAKTEANTRTFDGNTFNSKTGSSLADNSDSGSLSLSQETPYPFHGVPARPVTQHPGHPRLNHSYILLKNSETGELVQVPQYEYDMAGHLPNNETSAPLVPRVHADNTYQHPSPLQIEHNHPFTSSPPIIRFTNPSTASTEDSSIEMQQKHPGLESLRSGLSEGVQGLREKQSQHLLYKTTQDTSRVCDPAVDQNRFLLNFNEQSHQSSAWLSTVSEVTSSESSGHGRTFTRIVVLDGNGHVNQTPEQGCNREVGSSLADTSSPGVDFSSSPAPLASSPILYSDTLPSPRQGFHELARRRDLGYSSKHVLGDLQTPLAGSYNHGGLATSSTNTADRSRSHSASGLRLEYGKSSPRQRRSSSETYSRLMDSPSAHKASALNLSSSGGHTQQVPGSGLVLRNPFSLSDDHDFRYNSNQQNFIERRGRRPKVDDVSLDGSATPSSTESRPFVRDGVLRTDAALPTLDHPVYGRERPWDRIRPGRPRPRPNLDPQGSPLFQRPVARTESPHLHRIPRPPTPELLERHVLLSRVYLVSSMVIPPIALIYGHGYMDGVMRFHTVGEINSFRDAEKIIALCWGYGSSAICILATVITIIITSTPV